MPTEVGYVSLTLTVSREGKQFVSRCKELGTASCGGSVDEALDNIQDATTEYLNTIERLGQRSRIFEEKGIAVRKTRPAHVRILPQTLLPGSLVGPYVTKIPVLAWVSAKRRQRLPLVSSRQLLAALRRLAFLPDPDPSGGSHLSMYRDKPDGTKDVTTIVLGEKEIPRGTLKDILTLGGISESEFLDALRKRRRQ